MKALNILIDNIDFTNKGSELMVYSIIQKVKEKFPGANFVCRNIPQTLKIKYLYEFKNVRSKAYIHYKFIPNIIKKRFFGFFSENDIKVVLDTSGFRYGDQWKDYYTERYIDKIEEFYQRMKQFKCKIILMPQAFGPFNSEISKMFITKISRYFDVIYARDEKSFNYLNEALGANKKIFLAPDFTNIYKPSISKSKESKFHIYRNQVCIIPNSKVVSHLSRNEDNQIYIKSIIQIVKKIEKAGEKVFFLNHEGEEDDKLVNEILLKGNLTTPYIKNLNADEIKWVIGQSKLCITSRFHGLVSSLSQGIPSYCISWSHKYYELLKDYDFTVGLIDVEKLDLSLKNIIDVLKDDELRKSIMDRIKFKGEIQKHQTNLMWDNVLKVL